MEKYKIKGGVLLKYTSTPGDMVATIPGGVLKIGKYAFSHGNCPATVIVSEGVIEIDTMAFFACEELKKVILPSSLRRIGESAFDGTGLEYIVIPEGVRTIGKFAFMGCKRLREVRLPKTLTGMGEGAFATMGRLGMVQMPPAMFGRADSLLRSGHISPGIVMYTDERIMTHETKAPKPAAPEQKPAPQPETPESEQSKKSYILELATTDVSELIGRAKNKAIQASEQPILLTTADYARVEQRLQEANAKNADLLEQISAYQKDTEVMQHKVREMDALFAENQALKAQIKVLNAMMSEMKSQSAQLPGIPAEDPETAEALRAAEEQIDSQEQEINRLRDQLETAIQERSDTERENGRILAETRMQMEDLQRTVQELQMENRSLEEKLASAETAPVQYDAKIEDVLDSYLRTFSPEYEMILAERFRETARALLDYSAEETARIMQSAVIGSLSNKRLLRNLARQNGRPDIAEKI